MSVSENYIYSETSRQEIEGPFAIEQRKWFRTLQKRGTELRRLFFRPAGRLRERIVENPLTLTAMSQLKVPSRVADLGGASSLLGLELVYLGHEVYILDLRPYHLQHPRLVSKRIDILNNDFPDNYFDAICCISVIEHVGIARYGGQECPDRDLALSKEIGRLTRPDGLVLLSGPYGKGHDPRHDGKPHGYRIYNRDRLKKVFQGFEVESLRFFIMEKGCWLEKDQEIADNIPTARPIDAIFFAQLRVNNID